MKKFSPSIERRNSEQNSIGVSHRSRGNRDAPSMPRLRQHDSPDAFDGYADAGTRPRRDARLYEAQ